MKIVKVKIKRGVIKSIKDFQTEYDYICPLKNVEVGDYVLVDVFINKVDTFGVARIEEINELSEKEVEEKRIYGFCVMKMPKDFEEHCKKIKHIKVRQLARYNGTYHVKKRQKNVTRLE